MTIDTAHRLAAMCCGCWSPSRRYSARPKPLPQDLRLPGDSHVPRSLPCFDHDSRAAARCRALLALSNVSHRLIPQPW